MGEIEELDLLVAEGLDEWRAIDHARFVKALRPCLATVPRQLSLLLILRPCVRTRHLV